MDYGFSNFLLLWCLHLWKLKSSAWLFTIALQLVLPSDQRWFTLHLLLIDSLSSEGTAAAAAAASLQLCPILCNAIGSSPPDTIVSGILQARTLEWVAISSPIQESEK